jgi:hypothetical protein
LDLANTLVLETEISSNFFCLTENCRPNLFFSSKMKYSLKLKYLLPRHINTMVLEYFNFRKTLLLIFRWLIHVSIFADCDYNKLNSINYVIKTVVCIN